jgi:hypothetical protein
LFHTAGATGSIPVEYNEERPKRSLQCPENSKPNRYSRRGDVGGTSVSARVSACPKCGALRAVGAVPPAAAASIQRRKTYSAVWAVAILLLGYLEYLGYVTNLPKLPAAVQFRRALLGPGHVLILRNSSRQPLQVMASLTHPAINDTRNFDVYIAANGSTDIDKLNGWITQSGDHITLKSSHYQPWNGSIP